VHSHMPICRPSTMSGSVAFGDLILSPCYRPTVGGVRRRAPIGTASGGKRCMAPLFPPTVNNWFILLLGFYVTQLGLRD
jgi:hypothetical protein